MSLVLVGLVVAVAFMTVCWVMSVVRHNAALVDRAWGLVFVGLAVSYLVAADDVGWRGAVMAALVSVWGARLSWHLTVVGWGRGEDWRHREARARNPERFPSLSLLTLFWPQAIAAVAVSTPLLAAMGEGDGGLGLLDVLGGAVFLAGLGLESTADRQLRRFRQRNRDPGAVYDRGVWRYSRHPNYVGDALVWWGLGLMGLAAGPLWSISGPIGMTVFLVYGTGVRAMDRHMLATRGAAYAAYAQRTSAFVPLPHRRRPESHGHGSFTPSGGAADGSCARCPPAGESAPSGAMTDLMRSSR